MSARRFLVAAGASIAGTILGAQLMFVVQDAGSDSGEAPEPSARGAETGTSSAPASSPSASPSGRRVEGALLAWTPVDLDPALEPAARAAPGVTTVSTVRGAVVDLVASHDGTGQLVEQTPADWAIPLDAIAIDPGAHAAFASLADRTTVAGLGDGQALLSRTSAGLRRVGVGGSILLASGSALTVAGIVDDTTIGAAELAVTPATGAGLGIDTPRYALLAYDGDRAAVESAVRRAVPATVPVRFRAPGETPFLRQGDAVLPPLRLKELFGEFAYQRPAADEREFIQDPAWEAENLVERDMPIIGPMRCHRAVIDAIEGALRELETANLASLVDRSQFAGCWNPRLVRPGGDLSHHAWGVAFDLNYDANPTCQESVQDRRLVDVFGRWGFTWGGEWLCPDPAHFEYASPLAG